MKFKAVIRKGEDFGYVAEVPSLPGCVSQGDSVRKAIANIKEAIGLYIEDMKPEEIKKAADSKIRSDKKLPRVETMDELSIIKK